MHTVHIVLVENCVNENQLGKKKLETAEKMYCIQILSIFKMLFTTRYPFLGAEREL